MPTDVLELSLSLGSVKRLELQKKLNTGTIQIAYRKRFA